MQNKSFLKSLRILIAAGSVGGFVGGWALLAKAGWQSASPSSASAALVTRSAPQGAEGLIRITPVPSSTQNQSTLSAPTATSTPQPTVRTVQSTTSRVQAQQPVLKTGGS